MSKRFLAVFLSAAFIFSVFSYVEAQAGTRNYITQEYNAPDGVTMFTDVYMNETALIRVSESEGRNKVSGSGAARVKEWESDIQFVRSAPVLEMHFTGNAPMDMEFEVKLTNLTWFFRSVEDENSTLFCNDNYSGGIEKLLPTSYNTYKGRFTPNNSTGIGGVYLRELDDEVAYKLVLSDDNNDTATIVLINGADPGDTLYLPLITRMDYYADGKIEVIADRGGNISPGVYTVLHADQKANPTLETATITTIPHPSTGIGEVPISEILIEEKLYGSLENGALMLTAPEGFAILPNVDNEMLQSIDRHTLNIQDAEGRYVVNASLGGGLNWKNMRQSLYQEDPERDNDIKFSYRNPSGNLDTGKLIIEFDNLVKTTYQNPGSITITGLKLVPTSDDYEYGDIYIEVSAYLNLKNFVTEEILAGTLGAGEEGSGHLESYNIDSMELSQLIQTPEFKAKSYIKPVNNGLQPTAVLTRGQLCDMLYNLLADTTVSYTHSFIDVPEGRTYENAIAFCAEKGFISGYEDGRFQPDGNITRGEFAVILNNILKLDRNVDTDFVEKDHFAYEALKQLVNAQIMQGYGNNELGPDNLIVKQEAVAMINRAFERGVQFSPNGESYSDISEDDWAYGYMMNAACGYLPNTAQ